MLKYAIIVAGGKGERMGANVPKQFLNLKGKPVLMHTIEKFKTAFPDIQIILALPNNQMDYWEVLCKDHSFDVSHKVVTGGEARFYSVKNALTFVQEEGVVAVHDGVRPLVSEATIKKCFEIALEKGNAIPVVDVVDSLRFVSKQDGENKAVPRSCYKIVQTPQCFQSALLLKAYEQEFDSAFTDDASVVERLGTTIHLVEGNRENIKITTAEDLMIAEALLG
ncbi:MAG: 2-C-methyl-D-erythritol 4-phosphate cytidylyltransferase [Vicingus serpentipes]|nr:2-C-methyl-D-erythritol 4-phosphate cytidylyltransferase [Vicingus serpentipes]